MLINAYFSPKLNNRYQRNEREFMVSIEKKVFIVLKDVKVFIVEKEIKEFIF